MFTRNTSAAANERRYFGRFVSTLMFIAVSFSRFVFVSTFSWLPIFFVRLCSIYFLRRFCAIWLFRRSSIFRRNRLSHLSFTWLCFLKLFSRINGEYPWRCKLLTFW